MIARYPKSLRLCKRYQYRRLTVPTRRFVGSCLVIDCKENRLLRSRLGITVTRRYGKAHDRNRFKRLVREAFRLSHTKLQMGQDFNIKPRTNAKEAGLADFQAELLHFLGS